MHTQSTIQIAWHYTVGARWPMIEASKALLPIPIACAPKRERPVIWLSTNQQYEMTARKGWLQYGELRTLSMDETHERCGGLIRIGVDARHCSSMREFMIHSGISHQHLAGLYMVGREQGANPDEWLVSFRPIPQEQWLAIEAWDLARHAWVSTSAQVSH